MVTTEKVGRRTYITGNTFAHRDLMRSKGATWDPEKKAWWTGSPTKADEIVTEIGSAAPALSQGLNEREACLTGKAEYQGHTYYTTAAVTRDGAKQLLAFTDGSAKFWADRALVKILKTYESPKSLVSISAFRHNAGGLLEDGYYKKNGHVLSKGCYECRRAGRMCTSCHYDYE